VVSEGVSQDIEQKRVTQTLDFTCAWVSLFEKREGRWVMTGDVSTFLP
jgi:hypothetical protein